MRQITITINNKKYSAQLGQTVLDVCRDNKIGIPTLCKHPDLSIQGKCRVCLVEANGDIVTSCSTPVEDNMKVITNSDAVMRARSTNLELIYAEHIEKCANCIQDHSCALKDYAKDYGLKITRYVDRKKDLPNWHFGKTKGSSDGFIHFDSSKCIDCGICTEICRDKQTCDFYETVGKGAQTQTKPTDDPDKDCTYCGQCVVHCPVGAVQGVAHFDKVEKILKNKGKKKLIAQIAPSIRVSIGEEFNMPHGKVVTGALAASMKALGFDQAFDVSNGADFTTYEEARELIEWLTKGKDRPMLTSCCPGWVKFVEFYYPEFISHLTTTRSPHIHSGILAKSYWADLQKVKPENIVVVSIMPCTAKKQEISLETHMYNGLPIVDYTVTTREYAHMLRRAGIDFANISPEQMDNPFGEYSGAGVIYGASGGVMESALRSADYMLRVKEETGSLDSIIKGENYKLKKNTFSGISQSRIEFEEARGQTGIKEADVTVGGIKLKVAIVNGLANARSVLESIKQKKCAYDYIEVMACPGGCIGGGGQPVPVNAEIRKKRADSLYTVDKDSKLRTAHENESVLKVYREFFKGDHKLIEDLMHCKYSVAKRAGYDRKE
jgi:NADP-reducing hydrogenase subunit HndD